jgi:transposase InsO family protein
MIMRSDWSKMTDSQFDAYQQRVSLVETLLDDDIPEADRIRMRADYRLRTGIGDRTLRNWLRWYREGGSERLAFQRCFEPAPRIGDASLAAAVLKLVEERPLRTVPQLRRLLQASSENATAIGFVSDRTLYRFLTENGLSEKRRSALACAPGRESFHQFQASSAMVLVQGDARDGIWLPDKDGRARKTYLFAWVDDYSRRILHARYYWDEKLPRMEDSFRDMILRWGIPDKVYLDNGSVYIARQFAWVLSQLGIKKIHHPPYHAWCKGKVEAVMKTLKLDFQAEAERAGFLTLEELNTALWAWIDVEYNRRIHSTTGQAPAERFAASLEMRATSGSHRRVTDLAWFNALFLLRDPRTVTKYGTVKLCANAYAIPGVSPHSVVEIRYDPFDLKRVFRFEKGVCVQTLEVRDLVNEKAPALPQESDAPVATVSEDAARYFSRLRDRHAEDASMKPSPAYSLLRNVQS